MAYPPQLMKRLAAICYEVSRSLPDNIKFERTDEHFLIKCGYDKYKVVLKYGTDFLKTISIQIEENVSPLKVQAEILDAVAFIKRRNKNVS